MSKSGILLSIKPRFAEAILSGEKGVELRKVMPRYLHPGDFVLLYSSAPVKLIVGGFTIRSVIENTPSVIWENFGSSTCLTYSEYNDYYCDSKKAVAIVVDESWRFDNPVPILLSEWVSHQRPPQSFYYLNRQTNQRQQAWNK